MRLTQTERIHAVCAFVVPVVLVLFAYMTDPSRKQPHAAGTVSQVAECVGAPDAAGTTASPCLLPSERAAAGYLVADVRRNAD